MLKKRTLAALLVLIAPLVGWRVPSKQPSPHAQAAFAVYLPFVPQPEPPIEIAYSSLTRPRQSPFVIEGAIVNVAPCTVYSAALSARLYDETGNPLGTYTGTTVFVATFQGETNRFSIWTELWDVEPSGYEVTVDGWTWASAIEYAPITVLSVVVDQGSISTQVSGEVRNDQARDMGAIRLMVEPGTNGPYQFADLEATMLNPGETAAYSTVIIHPWEPPPAHVSVRGQGALRP